MELHRKWGGQASPDQLAGGLGSSPRSGAFRIKTSTARVFGVTDAGRKKISLTDLGRRLVDPQTRDAARVEAFLKVPLFAKIYEAYEGSSLPPDAGLERKISDLGVSEKQTAKARQAMQRSADLAGFFKTTPGRLVRPRVSGDSGDGGPDDKSKSKGGGVTPQPNEVPLGDLWLRLLNEGEDWPAEKIQEFVDAARNLHRVLMK
jgi:hypothetical protein